MGCTRIHEFILARDRDLDQDIDALKKEATTWIVRLTSGDATVADANALKRWRAQSPAHESAFQDAAQTWNRLGPALETQLARPRAAVTRRRFLAAGSLAAGSAGAAFCLMELGIIPSMGMLLADYATAIGEQRTIRMPDGSTAALDGGTALSVRFSQTERQASLVAGAAVFDVAHDSARPFTVSAANGRTMGSDASFAVSLATDEVSVECLRGHVGVECRGRDDLIQGEAVNYSADGLSEKTKADIATSAAWRNGLLVFKNRTVSDVVSDLNRHRRGKIIVANSSLQARRISGVFHLDRPEEVLSHLEATLHARPVSLPGSVVVLL